MENQRACPSCQTLNDFDSARCRKCRIELVTPNKPRFQSMNNSGSELFNLNQSHYSTAKTVATIAEWIGWIMIASGIALSMLLISSIGENFMYSLMQFIPGLGAIVSGLLIIMGAQVTKALVESADNSRALLQIAWAKHTKDID